MASKKHTQFHQPGKKGTVPSAPSIKRQQLRLAARLIKAAEGANDIASALQLLGDGQSALSVNAAAALLAKVAALVKDRAT